MELPSCLRDELEATARQAGPLEVCGLLLGRPAGLAVQAASVCRNSSPSPAAAFLIEPLELLGGYAAAQARGLDVIGVWHSHPQGPARPSQRDLAELQPGWLHLVIAPRPCGGLEYCFYGPLPRIEPEVFSAPRR